MSKKNRNSNQGGNLVTVSSLQDLGVMVEELNATVLDVAGVVGSLFTEDDQLFLTMKEEERLCGVLTQQADEEDAAFDAEMSAKEREVATVQKSGIHLRHVIMESVSDAMKKAYATPEYRAKASLAVLRSSSSTSVSDQYEKAFRDNANYIYAESIAQLNDDMKRVSGDVLAVEAWSLGALSSPRSAKLRECAKRHDERAQELLAQLKG